MKYAFHYLCGLVKFYDAHEARYYAARYARLMTKKP